MSTETGTNGRVSLTITDRVAELRLSHPEKLNAFTVELAEDLREMTEQIANRDDAEGDISVVLVTAEGRAFSAGADIDIVSSSDPGEARDRLQSAYQWVFDWLYNESIPVIGAARGPVVGAGASLLCYATDLQVAGSGVEIWWPEVAFGVAPLARTVYLANEIGANHALELMLLGEHGKVDADEAHELGLVNRVVPSGTVDETAREMAAVIADYDEQYGFAREFVRVIHHARRESFGASIALAARRRRTLG